MKNQNLYRKILLRNSQNVCGSVEIELEFIKSVEGKRTIDLRPAKPHWELSISGETRDCSGQCISEIEQLFGEKKYIKKLCRIWKRWHLNGLKAGTRTQAELVKKKFDNSSYDLAVELLKSQDAYEEDGYKYGCEWLVEYIPEDIIEDVKEIMLINAGD